VRDSSGVRLNPQGRPTPKAVKFNIRSFVRVLQPDSRNSLCGLIGEHESLRIAPFRCYRLVTFTRRTGGRQTQCSHRLGDHACTGDLQFHLLQLSHQPKQNSVTDFSSGGQRHWICYYRDRDLVSRTRDAGIFDRRVSRGILSELQISRLEIDTLLDTSPCSRIHFLRCSAVVGLSCRVLPIGYWLLHCLCADWHCGALAGRRTVCSVVLSMVQNGTCFTTSNDHIKQARL
jgi:hypothetical protein